MTPVLREGETLNVGILLYDQVEELDFCGPFEVFKAASIHAAMAKQREEEPLNVFTVAEQAGLVKTGGGLLIQPQFTFDDHPVIDLLVVPGGNAGAQVRNAVMVEWLTKVVQRTKVNTSVCTGAFLLGKVGLLDGHDVTTHWSALDRLAEGFPTARVQREVRWVDEGTLVTAAGISAGMDMSLHMVERLLGRDIAETTARYMEYSWNENGAR